MNKRHGLFTTSLKNQVTIATLGDLPNDSFNSNNLNSLTKNSRLNLAIYTLTFRHGKQHSGHQIQVSCRNVSEDSKQWDTSTQSKIPVGVTLCALSQDMMGYEKPQVYIFGGDLRLRNWQSEHYKNQPENSFHYDYMAGSEKVLLFQSDAENQFSCIGRLYHTRVNATCIPLPQGKRIAVIGGDRSGSAVEYFDIETQVSSVGSSLLEPRYCAGVVPLSDDPSTDLFVVGGLTGPFRGAALRSTERLGQKEYRERGPLISARDTFFKHKSLYQLRSQFSGAETARAAIGHKVKQGTDHLSSLFFSETTPHTHPSASHHGLFTSMRRLASMGQARAAFAITRIPNSEWIFVVGGYNGVRGLATTELYNIELDFWVEGPVMNYSRIHPFVWVANNLDIYVFGGAEYGSQKQIRTVEVWNASVLKCKKFHYKNQKSSFRIVPNVIGPPISFASSIVYSFAKPVSQIAVKPSTLYNVTIPKLELNKSSERPHSQVSICSTATDPRYSFETVPDMTPRSESFSKEDFLFEAPRNCVESYFHSPLVSKMKQRKALKSFLWV